MLHIAIINGPNLNLLGTRETNIYGNQSFEDYLLILKSRFPDVTVTYFQSNIEGELINHIQYCISLFLPLFVTQHHLYNNLFNEHGHHL